MRWIEIISLRCPANVNTLFLDDLLRQVGESERPEHLVGLRVYYRSTVETDLSIHIHWRSDPGSQNKSPLGLRVSNGLKDLGLLNHSVWVESAALEFSSGYWTSKPSDLLARNRTGKTDLERSILMEKEGF